MKSTTEIVMKKEGKKITVAVKSVECTPDEVLMTAQMGLVSLVMNECEGVPEEKYKELAKEFGEMMGATLLDYLQKAKVKKTDFTAWDAAFLNALMKRQGEAQNE